VTKELKQKYQHKRNDLIDTGKCKTVTIKTKCSEHIARNSKISLDRKIEM
jgi:hypothetical protein